MEEILYLASREGTGKDLMDPLFRVLDVVGWHGYGIFPLLSLSRKYIYMRGRGEREAKHRNQRSTAKGMPRSCKLCA